MSAKGPERVGPTNTPLTTVDTYPKTLTDEELIQYGIPEGERDKWQMLKQTGRIDDNDATVTTVSLKDKKDKKFFESRKIKINYLKNEKNIEIDISSKPGTARSEDIKVKVNGEELSHPQSKEFLSMNKTYRVEDAYLLDRVARNDRLVDAALSTTTDAKVIAPFIKVYSTGDADEKNKAAQERIQGYLENINSLPQNEKRLIFPILLNDDHWYSAIVDLNESKTPTITLIESINKMKLQVSLEEIISTDSYTNTLNMINNSLHTLGYNEVPFADVQFCQALQYGNMSCGITTSMNMQKFMVDKSKTQSETFHPEDLEAIETPPVFMEVEGMGEIMVEEASTKHVLKEGHDKSQRVDVVLDAVRRAELAMAVETREKMLDAIPDKENIPPENVKAKKETMREVETFHSYKKLKETPKTPETPESSASKDKPKLR